MLYNSFGLTEEYNGKEGEFYHYDYPGVRFLQSSFIKEWADKYIEGDIKIVFDIGAFEGGDSLRFSSWYPEAIVYSFEATLHNYNVIVKKLAGKHSNIKLFNKAMSSKNGVITLHQLDFPFDLTDDVLVMGSLYTANAVQLSVHGQKQIKPVKVESITFDAFCEENNITSVDIMHIDVEGATYNVCLGMNKVLPQMIFTEKENNHLFNKTEGGNELLIKLLKRKGYNLEKTLPNDFLFVLR